MTTAWCTKLSPCCNSIVIWSNYSGLNQYFLRNALFLPPSGEGIARFALEKWMA
jgi:hypothetical protein